MRYEESIYRAFAEAVRGIAKRDSVRRKTSLVRTAVLPW